MNKKLLLLFLLVILYSCGKDEDLKEANASQFDSQIILSWNDVYLDIERHLTGFRPCPTTRASAYIYMADYEVAIPQMPQNRSLSTLIDGFPELPKPQSDFLLPLAINACNATLFRHFLFNADAEGKQKIEELEARLNTEYGKELDVRIYDSSIAWGRKVANTIIAYADSDLEAVKQISEPSPSDYILPSGKGQWKPAPPNFAKPIFPYWGKVRTFANFRNELLADLPVPYSTNTDSEYFKQAEEVYQQGGKDITRKNLWIAEFWSDDLTGLTFSPPARQIAIADQLIELKSLDLSITLEMFCKLGISMNDAAVACWNSKYFYNIERPVTYIQSFIDSNFQPVLGRAINVIGLSPAFPAYPSGHSTFASAAAGIFSEYFGETINFTDRCHEERTEFYGTPRSFVTFNDMAEENAFSRIPLGVHFRMDCVEGLRMGYQIAEKANGLNLKK